MIKSMNLAGSWTLIDPEEAKKVRKKVILPVWRVGNYQGMGKWPSDFTPHWPGDVAHYGSRKFGPIRTNMW